jgi:DNA-binding beta-propeller fold protein YncE
MFGLSSGHGAVAIVDTTAEREIARLPGGVFPDGIAYDPRDNRIFVSDELGSAITVIEASTGSLIARIAAGGEVGNVQYDAASARLYAPIQTRNELGVFDPSGNKRLGVYALPGCAHPHGLAIAPNVTIGFVACDENDVLLTVDLRTGKVLGRLPLGHDPDVLAMDPILRRLYVACESGTLSTFDISNPASPASLGNVFVGTNAHSVAVDPASHQLYFPLADIGGISVLRILKPNL